MSEDLFGLYGIDPEEFAVAIADSMQTGGSSDREIRQATAGMLKDPGYTDPERFTL